VTRINRFLTSMLVLCCFVFSCGSVGFVSCVILLLHTVWCLVHCVLQSCCVATAAFSCVCGSVLIFSSVTYVLSIANCIIGPYSPGFFNCLLVSYYCYFVSVGCYCFYCSLCVVSIANCISGLYSPGFCSAISLFCWWCVCMKYCSYGVSDGVWFICFNSVIISSVFPYSCQWFNICCANADCGLLPLIYLMCSWYLCLNPV